MSISKKQGLINKLQGLKDNASLKDIDETIIEFFENQPEYRPWRSSAGSYIFGASLLLAVVTLCLTLFTGCATMILVCYGLWTILPPGWFMFEYVLLFPDYHKFNPGQMADLKYVHELAGKIWAGLVVVIGFVIYLKFHTKLHLP